MGLKVLVVDDEPRNIQVVGTLLRDSGYKVEYALNGNEALNWLKSDVFDLVLLDVMMPVMDGYQVCEIIKNDLKLDNLPVIFLTGKTDIDSISQGFKAGAVDYVTKPFNAQELLIRVETHLEIVRQKKELIELNKTKDRFLSIIGHDIKGPFSSIISLFDLMFNRGKIEDEYVSDLMKGIYKLSESTLELIENLLIWGKSQASRLKLNFAPINIETPIRETFSLLQGMADAKQINLIINSTDLEVYADVDMLKTILRNLISNAIKFTKSGGEVSVKTENIDDEFAKIIIRDTGVGMAQKEVDRLFKIDKYYTTMGTNGEQGTGLGLVLCAEFVNKNGGDIGVNSHENVGSEFWFTLPLNTVASN